MVFDEDTKPQKQDRRKENISRLDKIRTKRAYSEESGDDVDAPNKHVKKCK